MRHLFVGLVFFTFSTTEVLAEAQPVPQTNIAVWPHLAPGETSSATGTPRPPRNEPGLPVTRVEKIDKPTIDIFPADDPNGVGVLIVPGGGFNYVVTDKEGSEAAAILNQHGVSAFVLRYRTKTGNKDSGWQRPLQDVQRSLKLLRSRAESLNIEADKLGLLGFSSGGQLSARLLGDSNRLTYSAVDEIDNTAHRPDFAMLIYPWKIYEAEKDALVPEINITADLPPTFIVHTHDDASSSLGSVLFYAGLKKVGVNAELHVFANGGHGYGVRAKPGSNIGSWPDRMIDWMRIRNLAREN